MSAPPNSQPSKKPTSGIVPPWPPQVRGSRRDRDAASSANVRVGDDIVARIIGAVPSICSDVSRAIDPDIGLVEPGSRALTKDEVGGALDVTAGIDLVALLGENGVLVADKLDAVEALLVGVCRHGEGLRALAASVDEVDVVDFEVIVPGAQGGGQVVVGDGVLRFALGDGDGVAAVAAGVVGVAVDGERSGAGGDVDLLAVGTLWELAERGRRRVETDLIDEDALRPGGSGAQGINSSLDLYQSQRGARKKTWSQQTVEYSPDPGDLRTTLHPDGGEVLDAACAIPNNDTRPNNTTELNWTNMFNGPRRPIRAETTGFIGLYPHHTARIHLRCWAKVGTKVAKRSTSRGSRRGPSM